MAYRDQLIQEANSVPANIVSANAYSESNAEVLAIVNFSQTIQQITEMTTEELDSDDKLELVTMLSEIENTKDKSTRKGKAIEAIKWVGDKSANVIAAVAPVLLKGIMGW